MTKAKQIHLEQILREITERVFDIERQFQVDDNIRTELYRARLSIGFARSALRERPAADETLEAKEQES